ncbi:MAG: hypothetical protein JWM47_4497 [Acidimicrobiales bacterium]|nr:hypothetical protein [Acidimicrobiales bacterium]
MSRRLLGNLMLLKFEFFQNGVVVQRLVKTASPDDAGAVARRLLAGMPIFDQVRVSRGAKVLGMFGHGPHYG